MSKKYIEPGDFVVVDYDEDIKIIDEIFLVIDPSLSINPHCPNANTIKIDALPLRLIDGCERIASVKYKNGNWNDAVAIEQVVAPITIDDWRDALNKVVDKTISRIKKSKDSFDFGSTLSESTLFCSYMKKTVKQILEE